MSLFSQRQVTDVMISNVAADVAVTDGTGGTVEAGDSLLFKQKLSDGTFRNSGVIKASDILYVSKTVTVASGASTSSFTPVASGTGFAHSLIVTIDEWGSKSYEDQEFAQGQYVEQAGDTAVEVAEGLISNLSASLKNKNFSSPGAKVTVSGTSTAVVWDNPLFTFTIDATTGATIISEKLTQRYSRGKIGYERIVFRTGYKIYDSISSDDFVAVDVTQVKGAENPLDGKRVADLEWFAMSNYGDKYAESGYPHNLTREYIADPAGLYTVSFLIQKSLCGDGVDYGTQSESTLQIFCTADTASADATAIETAIETALGITLPTGTGKVE